ncbi:recombinase family protein [Globicatella sulfidifaciens]
MESSRNVTVIPARPRRTREVSDKQKLRVAAYCRVSTDSDEQATSYKVQIEHYTSYIQANPEWKLAGVYADDGITGTNTKMREQFNKMIQDCMDGKIDMIITKSISRFARNTLDCLKYIRKLKERDIPVFFEKENINSMDAKGEVMLTIMASLAQQESQSLSQNVKLGIQYRYQQGEVQVNHIRFLGYTKDENNQLVIVPEEAKIIKRIYWEYLEGASLNKIAKGLEADGILTGAGKKKWHTSSLYKMLTNEKYMGDALLQKTYTVDFLSKRRVKNDGVVPQYYVENNHEAIIPKHLFMLVQEELKKRRVGRVSKNGKRRNYSSNHSLAQMVLCDNCGEIFRRVHWNNRGKRSIVWRCVSRLENTGVFCDARTVREDVLKESVLQGINKLFSNQDDFIKVLIENISLIISSSLPNEIITVEKKLEELQHSLITLANSKEDYNEVVDDIYRLREKRQTLQIQIAEQDNGRNRMEEIIKLLETESPELDLYDEKLVRRLVDKVTIQAEKIEIAFKSGINVEVNM